MAVTSHDVLAHLPDDLTEGVSKPQSGRVPVNSSKSPA